MARGIRLGFPPGGPFPELPPGQGLIDELDDPIRIGNSELLSFSPLGSSSGGKLFVTDQRSRLYAVVLYGNTGKIRVWRYEARTQQWIF